MIEKPKRPKKIPNQDNKQPQTIQELIRRYDLDNTKIYDFLDELVGHIKQTQIVVSAAEPTGDDREKVWMQNTDTEQNIYIKNDNDEYIPFKEDSAERITLLTALDGYSVSDQYIYKQGKNHYFGWVIIQKNSGNFTGSQETVATLSKTPTYQYNFFGAGATDKWESPTGFAYAFINNSKQLLIRAQNCNYVKLHIDIVTTD